MQQRNSPKDIYQGLLKEYLRNGFMEGVGGVTLKNDELPKFISQGDRRMKKHFPKFTALVPATLSLHNQNFYVILCLLLSYLGKKKKNLSGKNCSISYPKEKMYFIIH